MNETNPTAQFSIGKLILIPSVITLGITVLRLAGELMDGPSFLFGRAAGGGGALVGISWLPLIFGPYFAIKLANLGRGPAGAGRAVGLSVAGVALFFVASYVSFFPQPTPAKMAAGAVIMLVAAAAVWVGWPTLGKTLIAYGYAARIPVLVVMYFAIRGNWGTHYDGMPPNYTGPETVLGKFFFVGVLPQLIFWVVYTLVVGALLGTIAAAIVHRKRPLTPRA